MQTGRVLHGVVQGDFVKAMKVLAWGESVEVQTQGGKTVDGPKGPEGPFEMHRYISEKHALRSYARKSVRPPDSTRILGVPTIGAQGVHSILGNADANRD